MGRALQADNHLMTSLEMRKTFMHVCAALKESLRQPGQLALMRQGLIGSYHVWSYNTVTTAAGVHHCVLLLQMQP